MPLLASEDDFHKVFRDEEKTFTEDFMIGLRAYLITKDKERHKLLLGALDRCEPLSAFQVRGDAVDSLCLEFLVREIPFVLVLSLMGEYGIIVRSNDRNAVINIIIVVLRKKSIYMRIMTGAELVR